MGLISQPLLVVPTRREAVADSWVRRLAPTLGDFFFVALLVWLFAAGNFGWSGLLADGDAGWHIRTGEYVLANGRAPSSDLFSFSKPGQPWFAWEWLADAAMAWLFGLAGLKGVVLAAGVVIAGTASLVFGAMLWRGANPLIAMLVCLLGVGASSIHYLARPHILTLLLMAVSVWLLARDRREPTRWLWALIPLTALWSNLHGGFVALGATIGLLVAGSAAEAFLLPEQRGRRLGEARRYAALGVGCALASLANPYGFRLHLHVISYLRSDWIRRAVEEFQSPSFRDESMLQFEALLVAGLLFAAAAIGRRQVVEALWVVFWIHAALSSVRHVPIYVVVAAPLIAAEATRWWNSAARRCAAKSVVGILRALGEDSAPGFRRMTVWAGVPVLVLAAVNEPVQWPTNFPREKFPVDIVERYRERLALGRVFTSDQWADYLIFRSYPKQRVFFDGRSDFYGPELTRQYQMLIQAHHQWEQLLERHRFDLVLSPVDWPLATLLKRDARWRIVADDGQAILFERLGTRGGTAKGEPEETPLRGLKKTPEGAESTRGDHSG
jgi:hypothetical protein